MLNIEPKSSSEKSTAEPIQVVAGVIYGGYETPGILISRRPAHLHQGGLWEFPGGKIETGETQLQSLSRELAEELDIQVTRASPLITIEHDYSDKHVQLFFWSVTGFIGEPCGVEGQRIKWVLQEDLHNYDFPDANHRVIELLKNSK